jgi:hypothetical protein
VLLVDEGLADVLADATIDAEASEQGDNLIIDPLGQVGNDQGPGGAR